MVRVEEVDVLSNIENDENVECPVDANFADEWNISINLNPNVKLSYFKTKSHLLAFPPYQRICRKRQI